MSAKPIIYERLQEPVVVAERGKEWIEIVDDGFKVRLVPLELRPGDVIQAVVVTDE